MKHFSKYDGIEKSYLVGKKKLKVKKLLTLIGMPAVILLIAAIFCIFNSFTFKDINSIISYTESAITDYRVYLKENEYYPQKYISKSDNMNLVSSLIDYININYKYEMHSSKEINYNYKYRIIADLVITEKGNEKELLRKNYVLKTYDEHSNKKNNYVLNESIDIPFDKYKEEVTNFKQGLSLAVNSNLQVTLEVITSGDLTDNKSVTKKGIVNIPLSDQTISITTSDNGIVRNGLELLDSNIKINYGLLLIGIVIALAFTGLFAIIIYLYVSFVKNRDIYEEEINKYLKGYDRIIISTKQPNIDERLFDEIIRVVSFEELVDLHDISNKPIIYYEVIPNEKSYFVIIQDRILYKLTITRGWLERQKNKK